MHQHFLAERSSSDGKPYKSTRCGLSARSRLEMYEAITKIIENYWCAPNTDYAILLNGEWGCGKTYYVEHELKTVIKNAGGTFIYASLHGIKDCDQLNTQLMLSWLENVAEEKAGDVRASYWLSRSLQNIKESSGLLTKITRSFCLGWYDKYVREAYRIDRDTTFVVIDDLERVVDENAMKQALGWVYEQYIRRGYHVLLIGDETKIKEGSAYFECKEKYVRRTINVSQWQNEFALEFARLRCVKPSWLYQIIKTDIERFLRSKKVTNLRSVAMIIDGLVDVVANLGEEFSKQYVSFLFTSLAPLLHAVSKGLLVADDIETYAHLDELNNIMFYYNVGEKRGELGPELKKACCFYDEYCKELNDSYVFVRSLFVYALTGYIDSAQIKSEVEAIFNKSTTPEGEALSMIRSYWTSEEIVLQKAVKNVKAYLEDGQYSMVEIVDIYSYFWGIKNDIYLSQWPFEEDLLQMFLRFMDIRIGRGVENLSQMDITTLDIRGITYQDSRANVQPLYDKIREHYKHMIRVRDEARMGSLFECLKAGDCIRANEFVMSVEGRWNLFEDIDIGGKIRDISTLPVAGLKFIGRQAREHILGILNSADFEYRQVPSIQKLIACLNKYVEEGNDIASRLARIKELIAILQNSIKHMEDYRKQQMVRLHGG